MIAIDGKEYQHDTWYPMPFIFEGLSLLPFRTDSVEAQLLLVRLSDGTERHWGPWNYRRGEIKTHWCVRLEGWYEI